MSLPLPLFRSLPRLVTVMRILARGVLLLLLLYMHSPAHISINQTSKRIADATKTNAAISLTNNRAHLLLLLLRLRTSLLPPDLHSGHARAWCLLLALLPRNALLLSRRGRRSAGRHASVHLLVFSLPRTRHSSSVGVAVSQSDVVVIVVAL